MMRVSTFDLRATGAFVVFLLGSMPGPAPAQWTANGAKMADRHASWLAAKDDPYAPQRAIGASSLAFGPDETLHLACEKFPDLLSFPPDGSKPRRTRLSGVKRQRNGQPDVDFEAISIAGGWIYLIDEDEPVLYATPLDQPGPVTILKIGNGQGRIDTTDTTGTNGSDHSSIEGLVVSEQFLGPGPLSPDLWPGPYFYLLDERDMVGGKGVARLYIATRDPGGKKVNLSAKVVTFPLEQGYRLPELFAFQGKLYALMTRFEQGVGGTYKVVRCDLENGTLREVCDFTAATASFRKMGYDTNYEGAAVAPNGSLYLTADNESLPYGSWPPPQGRDLTPIIKLKPSGK